jgi:hypothetical protein
MQPERAGAERRELVLLLGYARQPSVEGVAPLLVGAVHETTQGARALQQGYAAVATDVVESPEHTVLIAHHGQRGPLDIRRDVRPGRGQLLAVRHDRPGVGEKVGTFKPEDAGLGVEPTQRVRPHPSAKFIGVAQRVGVHGALRLVRPVRPVRRRTPRRGSRAR